VYGIPFRNPVYGLDNDAYYPQIIPEINKMHSTIDRCSVIEETISQYTGLTDKCGTKIFEGDIIQNVTEGKTAVVQWFSEHSAFMLWCKSENQVYWLYDNDFLNIEVIGNIYDNPELLGGTDNGCKKV
jgi:uncharacterized phage protein (TIGR01671 family)